jgi:hypothetical protein
MEIILGTWWSCARITPEETLEPIVYDASQFIPPAVGIDPEYHTIGIGIGGYVKI